MAACARTAMRTFKIKMARKLLSGPNMSALIRPLVLLIHFGTNVLLLSDRLVIKHQSIKTYCPHF